MMFLVTLTAVFVAFATASTNTNFPSPVHYWSNDHASFNLELVTAADSTFYFSGTYAIFAFDAVTGVNKYNITYASTDGLLCQPLAYSGGWIYFVIGRQTFAYQNNILKWNSTTIRGEPGSTLIQLSPDGSKLAVIHNDAHVHVHNAITGDIIFGYDANHAATKVPLSAVFARDLLISGNPGGTIVAFKSATGEGIWQTDIAGYLYSGIATSAEENYVAVLFSSGSGLFNVSILATNNGTVIWTTQQTFNTENTQVWGLTVSPSNVLLVSTGDRVFAFTLHGLQLKWIQSVTTKTPILYWHDFAIVTENIYVSAIELESGDFAWTVSHASGVSANIQDSNMAIVQTQNGPVVAVSLLALNAAQVETLYRAAWLIPRHATITRTSCKNGPSGPCTTSCVNQSFTQTCVPEDSSDVSTYKHWIRHECFTDSLGRNGMYYKRYQGTACGSPAGTVVYETQQYEDQCVVDQNFDSSIFLSCLQK